MLVCTLVTSLSAKAMINTHLTILIHTAEEMITTHLTIPLPAAAMTNVPLILSLFTAAMINSCPTIFL